MKKNFSKGFTLIEILVGLGLLTVITLLIGSFGLDIFESQITFSRTLEIQQEIQQTFGELLPEIRSAKPSDNGSYPIAKAEQETFEFYSDIDGDGTAERVRYFKDGSVFKRGITKSDGSPPSYSPSDEKINNLVRDLAAGSSTVFLYYEKGSDDSGPPLDFPVSTADVGLVRIEIKVDPKIQGAAATTFSMQANPRNLRQ